MGEVKAYRVRRLPCRSCKTLKADDQFYWYTYTTNQGKRSLRRDSDCKECAGNQRKRSRDLKHSAQLCREWRAKNRDSVVGYARRYRASGEGKKKRALAQAARSARHKAGITLPEDPAILAVYQEAKDIETKLAACVACDDPLEMKMHVDHVVPLSKGGLHVRGNLQILSARENLAKGASLHALHT